jgi:hypothetical protein
VASGLLVGVKLQPAERKKYTRQNCAPSWIHLQDGTRLYLQQNIKFIAADIYQNPCKTFAADTDLIQTRRIFK